MDYKAKPVLEELAPVYYGTSTSYSIPMQKLYNIMEECKEGFIRHKDLKLSIEYGNLDGGFLDNGKGLMIGIEGSRFETADEILLRNKKTLVARKATIVQLSKQLREICENAGDSSILAQLKQEIFEL